MVDKKKKDIFQILLPLFVTVLLASILYRAATLSMTWDESYTVCVYATDVTKIFSPADFFANNHVPHTLLVGIMFQLFPWQEWALRLPAILAGIGTILLLWHIGLRTFVISPYRNTFLLIALVSLHPLIFQFFSFARGYSASLFFSLLGFYLLQNLSPSNFPKNSVRLTAAGLAFGFSVAFNLSAALTNSALIAAWMFLEFKRHEFCVRELTALLLRFCLPGAAVVLLFYAPFLLSVPQNSFDYAAPTFLDGLIDMSVWTLGNSNDVPSEQITRLILGIPVSNETFFFVTILLPLFAFMLFMWSAITSWRSGARHRPLAVIVLGFALYLVLIFVGGTFGKAVFPKDRTGMLPMCYLLMLPVFLLNYYEISLKNTRAGQWCQRILVTGMALTIFHFVTLFAYPYYHNFWYADHDVRLMMKQAEEVFQKHEEPKRIVCSFRNMTAVQFYKEKYAMDDVEYHWVKDVNEWNTLINAPVYTLFLMPESALNSPENPSFKVLFRNPYSGVALFEL